MAPDGSRLEFPRALSDALGRTSNSKLMITTDSNKNNDSNCSLIVVMGILIELVWRLKRAD